MKEILVGNTGGGGGKRKLSGSGMARKIKKLDAKWLKGKATKRDMNFLSRMTNDYNKLGAKGYKKKYGTGKKPI